MVQRMLLPEDVMPGYRSAYFFTHGWPVPTKLAKDLDFAAKTSARYARAYGFESHSINGRHVLVRSWPQDFVNGFAHELCDEYDVGDAWTLEPAMTPGSVTAIVTIQFYDDGTEDLALMYHWPPNAIPGYDANIWRLREPIPGYSSPMVDFQFGKIKPPDLHPERFWPTAPNSARYIPAVSLARSIRREEQQSIFPRPFLLYGSQEDPVEIANLLRLKSLPVFCKGLVSGFKMMLHGIKPAVVFGSREDIVHGIAYVVQSREDADKLRPGKNYSAFPCGIRLDGAPCSNHSDGIREFHHCGAIFRWVGDHSRFSVQFGQDIAV
ncbi:hypothetical protein N7G274_000253 [Stereocaulon virgatum]|uniref:Uncharacterized protein n=1 Tax=Stereocaulon virgatum TaxID=373712 RepID=A0ABR4ARL0_9LECA